jgi:hypothetical protein
MLATKHYSLEDIKEEARQLVFQKRVSRQQCIYALCNYLPSGEWQCIERTLEENDFLLRDHIIDLLEPEEWDTD